MTIPEIDALAELARLEIESSEKEGLIKDFESILSYIDQIKSATIDDAVLAVSTHRNVMRADENPKIPGSYTLRMLKEAPDTEDGYIKVKQIL